MKTDKEFDCVQMQRSIRNKISSDIEKMSNDKILEYIRKGSKAFEETMARR